MASFGKNQKRVVACVFAFGVCCTMREKPCVGVGVVVSGVAGDVCGICGGWCVKCVGILWRLMC